MTGKKHEKRLAYLKFSLDTQDSSLASYSPQYQAQHPILPTGLPTVYAYPPPCPSYGQGGPAYYYPGPPVQPFPYPYHEYPQGAPAAPPPGQAPAPQHAPRAQGRRREGGAGASQGGAPHGVMSPSLTSGFSGSGDCKSTETCSLLSVASYSSATPGGDKQPPAPASRHVVSCEVRTPHQVPSAC